MEEVTPYIYYFIVFVVLTIMCGRVLVFLRHKKNLQIAGIALLRDYRLLVSHIQRHRGLTTYYLSNRFTFNHDILDLQQGISRDFQYFLQYAQKEEDVELWTRITQHWARLASVYRTLSVDNNILQHSQLIKNILLLASELESKNYVHELQRDSFSWLKLLHFGELIGQLRALGTVVIAGDRSEETYFDTRRQLNRIAHETSSLLAFLTQENAHIGFDKTHGFFIFLDSLLKADDDKRPYDAEHYFKLASEVLDYVYESFDKEIDLAIKKLAIN